MLDMFCAACYTVHVEKMGLLLSVFCCSQKHTKGTILMGQNQKCGWIQSRKHLHVKCILDKKVNERSSPPRNKSLSGDKIKINSVNVLQKITIPFVKTILSNKHHSQVSPILR